MVKQQCPHLYALHHVDVSNEILNKTMFIPYSELKMKRNFGTEQKTSLKLKFV